MSKRRVWIDRSGSWRLRLRNRSTNRIRPSGCSSPRSTASCGRCGYEAAHARVAREGRATAVERNADIYRLHRQRQCFVAPDVLYADRPVAKDSLER